METLTMEYFQATLESEQGVEENSLFAALRTIQQLAFSADDLLDGVDGAGWQWWH